jgi:hypothetical protein
MAATLRRLPVEKKCTTRRLQKRDACGLSPLHAALDDTAGEGEKLSAVE